jgi:hypothetical protein
VRSGLTQSEFLDLGYETLSEAIAVLLEDKRLAIEHSDAKASCHTLESNPKHIASEIRVYSQIHLSRFKGGTRLLYLLVSREFGL